MDVCPFDEALCNVGSPLKRGLPGDEDDENYPIQRPRIGGGAGGDPTLDGQDALAAVVHSERPEWFGAAHRTLASRDTPQLLDPSITITPSQPPLLATPTNMICWASGFLGTYFSLVPRMSAPRPPNQTNHC